VIKTIANLLTELKKNGIDLIDESVNVNHPGLTGDIYEGLTTKLLNKTIFKNFDLSIASGKIKNNKNELSSQIDCMLVVGKGESIPFTDKYIYHYSQVIAVIEVKKTLNKQQLIGSYENLKSIIKVSRSIDLDAEPYVMRLLKTSWEILTNTELPKRENLNLLPENMQFIYHTLLMEAFFPLRIVFGYFGYKSEYSLREGFVDLLNERIENNERKGFGIGSFPNLIICNNNSLIKSNGMPFAAPFQKNEFYWPILLSSNKTPLLHLLEFIWTRLSFKFGISSLIFDDELTNEYVHQFLDCKFDTDNKGNKGWSYFYHSFSKENLNVDKPVEKWEPVEINKNEFTIINILGSKGEIFYTDKLFIDFLKTNNCNLKELLNSLHTKKLIFYDEKSMKLSTSKCVTIFNKGKTYAGDDFNGMMTKWILNENQK